MGNIRAYKNKKKLLLINACLRIGASRARSSARPSPKNKREPSTVQSRWREERKGKEETKRESGPRWVIYNASVRVCVWGCFWGVSVWLKNKYIYIDMKQTSRWPLSAIVWCGNRLENEILCTQTSIHNTHQAKRQLRSLVASHITHTSHPTVLGCVTIWANPDRQKCREIWGGRWSRAWASQAVSIYRKRLCCASVWAGACKWVHVQTLSEPTT